MLFIDIVSGVERDFMTTGRGGFTDVWLRAADKKVAKQFSYI